MSTATREEVERGGTEDPNIPNPTLCGEVDFVSAVDSIVPFTVSSTNEASSPKQGIATATTGPDSDTDNLDPIPTSGFGSTGKLTAGEKSEIRTK